MFYLTIQVISFQVIEYSILQIFIYVGIRKRNNSTPFSAIFKRNYELSV